MHWVVPRQKISSLLCNSLRKSLLQRRWMARSCTADVESSALTDSNVLIPTKRLQTAGASSLGALRAAFSSGLAAAGRAAGQRARAGAGVLAGIRWAVGGGKIEVTLPALPSHGVSA